MFRDCSKNIRLGTLLLLTSVLVCFASPCYANISYKLSSGALETPGDQAEVHVTGITGDVHIKIFAPSVVAIREIRRLPALITFVEQIVSSGDTRVEVSDATGQSAVFGSYKDVGCTWPLPTFEIVQPKLHARELEPAYIVISEFGVHTRDPGKVVSQQFKLQSLEYERDFSPSSYGLRAFATDGSSFFTSLQSSGVERIDGRIYDTYQATLHKLERGTFYYVQIAKREGLCQILPIGAGFVAK